MVKAYNRAVAGFLLDIRFKACLPGDRDFVNFQTKMYRGIPDRSVPRIVNVDVQAVYPLPNRVLLTCMQLNLYS